MKRYTIKKGMAVISALGICFILLGLASVLMLNSYSHMSMSMRYYYDTEALNVAESGIHYMLYKLETYGSISSLPATTNYSDSIGRGTFNVYEYSSNIGKSTSTTIIDAFGDSRIIPPYSILVVSKGTVPAGGGNKSSKIVEAIVHYQFVPMTLYSDGAVSINTDPGTNPLILKLTANPDRFPSNIHCNYSAGNTFSKGSNVSLSLYNSTVASSGTVGDAATVADIISGNGIPVSNVPTKQCLKLEYDTLKARAKSFALAGGGNEHEMNENVPKLGIDLFMSAKVKFLGQIKNDGGTLKAKVHIYLKLGFVTIYDFEDWQDMKDYLPDGMSWNNNTLTVSKNNIYHWGGNLDINPGGSGDPMHIQVNDNIYSGLFIDGYLRSYHVTVDAQSFTFASAEDIWLYDSSMHIYSPINKHTVAIYGKSFTLTTRATPIAGGNTFKGVVYTTDGTINLENKCTDTANNSITIEGIIINADPDKHGNSGVIVKNTGASGCVVTFRYNPYVTDSTINYSSGPVYLQPVFWRIE